MRMLAALGVFVLCELAPRHADAQPVSPSPSVPTPDDVRQRVTRATVSVRDGTAERARGVVLAPDGRILTALAAVQGGTNLRVQYPDGRVDRARIVGVDPAWGIALLQGGAARWPEGVTLAAREPRSRDAAMWVPAVGVRPVVGTLVRRRSFVGAGAALLRDAWELSPIPPRSAAGSGVVLQSSGALVGVIVPPAGSQPITGAESLFAAPLFAIRNLAERVIEQARPWLGVVTRELRMGEDAVLGAGGLRVVEVQSGSPAQRAGLRPGPHGDVIVSVDGQRVATLNDLGAAIEGRRPGDVVTFQVMRQNAQIDVTVRLDVLPER